MVRRSDQFFGRTSTISHTFDSTFSSDHAAWPTKCSNDWCCAAVRPGAVTAAIGGVFFVLLLRRR